MRQTCLLRPGILANTPGSRERATLAAIAPEILRERTQDDSS